MSAVPPASGQVDLCYVERGIVGVHGYASDGYVEPAEWLVPVPESLREIGVLMEPLRIVPARRRRTCVGLAVVKTPGASFRYVGPDVFDEDSVPGPTRTGILPPK